PLSGSVQTPDALLFGRVFKDLQLQLHSSAQGLQVQASGPTLAGSLNLPDDLQRAGITANLKRLYWPAESAGASGTPAAAAPMAAVNPASLPPLHLRVDDFHLGAAQFGSANFQSTPIAGGLRIDQLDSHSPNVSMRAQGNWMGDAQNNRTQMNIEFSAADLGHMLEALGYQNLVAGGR
ncbi:hypothetical protein B1A_00846, partial [mine drainage metagenome]